MGDLKFSYTPSFCIDGQSGITIPVILYKALGKPHPPPPYNDNDYSDMESAFRVLRRGTLIDGSGDTILVHQRQELGGILSRKRFSDFNGDGNNDILFRHPSTGDVYLWLMNGSAFGF